MSVGSVSRGARSPGRLTGMALARSGPLAGGDGCVMKSMGSLSRSDRSLPIRQVVFPGRGSQMAAGPAGPRLPFTSEAGATFPGKRSARRSGTVDAPVAGGETEANLRAFAQWLVRAQEDERRAIARLLHDQVGQSLTVLLLVLDQAMRAPAGEAAAGLKEAKTAANELVGSVRNLSLDLRPPMLDELGLLSALVWYSKRCADRSQFKVDFQHSGLDRQVPPDVGMTAFRIVQEALANVMRHAGVAEAAVVARVEGDALYVSVEDRGAGFDPAAVEGRGGGLNGMRERARLLGGDLTVHSAPGAGTLVRAQLPLRTTKE